MFLDGELGPQDVELGADPDVQVDLLNLGLDAEAGHSTLAGRGWEDARDHGDQGGLAGAVGAQQSEHLSVTYP